MKTHAELSEQWRELTAKEPNLRIRDAAERLGVSEAELLATRVGAGVIRLAADWSELVKEMPTLGRVMCLTRNEHAVHERYGNFLEIAFLGHGVGQVVGPDIDLRLFMTHWHFGFAVTDETKDGPRKSLQFFDADGTAVHKVYLNDEKSDLAAYEALVKKYTAEDQTPGVTVTPAAPKRPERPDAEVDVEAFRKGWLELKESHGFFMLMHKHKLAREQALRLAPEGYAWRVDRNAAELLLNKASADDTPIMVFIGSEGCIQIHTGPVKNIKRFGEVWINVLDDDFNMHLRDSAVTSAWVVRKPTYEGGVVTSVELFDDKGENLALFFGKRKPGQLEDPIWAQLAEGLPKVEEAVSA